MIRASKIASFLGGSLAGPDIEITIARSLASVEPGAIVFLNKGDASVVAALNRLSAVLCVTTPEIAPDLNCAVIPSDNPRLAFCKALNEYFPETEPARAGGAITVSDTAQLGKDVVLGAGVCIGADVRIGPRTRIGANVVIEARTVIGSGCVIKPNSTIGARGFGFVRDHDNTPISFPHIGMVRIGDGVEIGANCTVVRAALDETSVGDHIKTDDHVHIAHNCSVGARTFIAAGVVVSGSVTIGADVWIGPNATIIDYISVGDGAHIALGSVVMRPVDPGVKVLGNPAKRVPGSGR